MNRPNKQDEFNALMERAQELLERDEAEGVLLFMRDDSKTSGRGGFAGNCNGEVLRAFASAFADQARADSEEGLWLRYGLLQTIIETPASVHDEVHGHA